MKIVIAGASGFIGHHLSSRILDSHELIQLVRSGTGVHWDGKTLGPWAKELDGADVVINLAGAPVTLPWTQTNKKLILESRTFPTAVIAEAINLAQKPPKVWINGSAVGYYGNRADEILDELSAVGNGFLPETCAQWENAAGKPPNTRLIFLRTGVVLGTDGGALVPLLRLTSAFLGGAVGSGKQWMPWIHVDDLVSMMFWAIENNISGPINGTAPNPVTNADFMTTLRKVVGRPWAPPTPAFGLKLVNKVGGPDPSVLLDSTRAIPKQALDKGFKFEFEDLLPALQDLLA